MPVTRATELDALAQAVGGGELRFGELVIDRAEDGYRVSGPCRGSEPVEAPRDLVALRAFVRTGEDGAYRPLSGARTLRGDWELTGLEASAVLEVLDVVYPLAWRHRCQEAAGCLRVVSFDEVLLRQSGPAFDEARMRKVCGTLCAGCVRTPRWCGGGGEADIPCPEPCNLLMTRYAESAGDG